MSWCWPCHCQEFPLSQFTQQSQEDNQTASGVEAQDSAPVKKGQGAETNTAGSASKRQPPSAASPAPKKARSKESCGESRQKEPGSSSSQRQDSKEVLALVPAQAEKTLDKSKPAVISGVPKWIYRKGQSLFVDLGGRRMKDAAAATVAKFVRSILEKVRGASTLDLCLLLAGNRLGQSGLEAFLNTARETGHHVSYLDVERNRLDADAVDWLAGWLTKQRRGPPQKLLLSHNRSIRDAAAKDFLQRLGRSQSGRNLPLWVEARFIGISDVEALLDELSVDVNFCMALDHDACSQTRCTSHPSETSELGPQLHLPGILEQHLNDLEVPAAKSEVDRSKAHVSSGQGDLKGLASAGSSAAREAHTQASGHAQVPASWRDEPAKPSEEEDAEAASIERERAERKAWANSLGRSAVAEMPSQEPPPPAPSCGLWDLVRAERRKKRRASK